MHLFKLESSDAKRNAQRNLIGRTHYVDDDTLRFHKSKILNTRVAQGGLLFGLISSDALDWNNTRRGFRFVIFDIFGNVLERPDLEHTFKTSAQALKTMLDRLKAIDGISVTLSAIAQSEANHARDMADLRAKLATLQTRRAPVELVDD